MVKEELKLKGVRFTAEVADEATASTLRNITRNRSTCLNLPQHIIKKDMNKLSMKNMTMLKQLRFMSTKRHIDEESPFLDTLPYGHGSI